jgi:hypothetical protein
VRARHRAGPAPTVSHAAVGGATRQTWYLFGGYGAMALREFTDGTGTTWRVWETQPIGDSLGPEFRHGWLVFAQGAARRRLVPIPEGWAEMPERELRRLCLAATPAAPRRRVIV